MSVHAVTFLSKNFSKIGVPETHYGTQKEDNKENSGVAVIDGLGWFHNC